ncbi:hypothetical protein [Azospirillum sp. sgz302134]
MGWSSAWTGALGAGCVAAGLLVSGPGTAQLAEVQGLRLEAAGPLGTGTRDSVLARAAREAVARAWQARYPDKAPPHLSDWLVARAVRHIDLRDETIAADRYTAMLDVAVALDVLRAAAGLPPETAPEFPSPNGPVPRVMAPTGGRWIHVGSTRQPEPLRIGRFVGSGQSHPGFRCLSAQSCPAD